VRGELPGGSSSEPRPGSWRSEGHLIEEQGVRYLAGIEADQVLTPLQAASCIYRIALGPRAGQKVLSLHSISGRGECSTRALCADAHGFSLHAAVRCGAEQHHELEQLCRYITSRRPDVAAVVSVSAFAHPAEAMRRLLAQRHVPYPFVGWYVLRHVQRVIGSPR
jgi:hypothetical protein